MPGGYVAGPAAAHRVAGGRGQHLGRAVAVHPPGQRGGAGQALWRPHALLQAWCTGRAAGVPTRCGPRQAAACCLAGLPHAAWLDCRHKPAPVHLTCQVSPSKLCVSRLFSAAAPGATPPSPSAPPSAAAMLIVYFAPPLQMTLRPPCCCQPPWAAGSGRGCLWTFPTPPLPRKPTSACIALALDRLAALTRRRLAALSTRTATCQPAAATWPGQSEVSSMRWAPDALHAWLPALHGGAGWTIAQCWQG